MGSLCDVKQAEEVKNERFPLPLLFVRRDCLNFLEEFGPNHFWRWE